MPAGCPGHYSERAHWFNYFIKFILARSCPCYNKEAHFKPRNTILDSCEKEVPSMFHGCVIILFVPSRLVKWLLNQIIKRLFK